jgi:hypothetical protein
MAPLGAVLHAALLATNVAACAAAGAGFWSFLRPASSAPPAGPAGDETSWSVAAIRVDAGPLDRPAPDVQRVNTTGFVTTEGTRFMRGCQEFLPIGAAVQLCRSGAGLAKNLAPSNLARPPVAPPPCEMLRCVCSSV